MTQSHSHDSQRHSFNHKSVMMRRGVGIAGLQQKKQAQETFKQKGTEIQTAELEQMREQLTVFKKNLEEFAQKYKKSINRNPEFRKHFVDMCLKIGVDPLASNKGFWSEMLGVGDFYYELAVQILEICLRTRAKNGGLIEAQELCNYLTKSRGQYSQPITVDDIMQATKKLKMLGSGLQLLSVGSTTVIQSVPCELNNDHSTVLVLAQEKKFVTTTTLEKELQWKKDRIKPVLDLLLHEGMAWVDDQHESNERAYWFPAFLGGTLSDL